MEKNKWIIDVTLIIIILVMSVFVYLELDRLMEFIRGPLVTLTPEETSNPVVLNEPTEVPDLELETPTEKPAPDFELINLSGETVALSDHRGTAVIVNFWATWCPPCLAEMPMIQEFTDKYDGKLIVLAVNVGENESVVRNFLVEHDLDFIFLLDPAKSVTSLYRILGFPTSLFIDKEGILRATHIGEMDETLLANYLRKVGLNE